MAFKVPFRNRRLTLRAGRIAREGSVHHGPEHSGSRYARQRRGGFPWLRFHPELEAEFRQSSLVVNLPRIRVAVMIGLAGIFGFILVDQFLGSNLQPALADLLLLVVTVPALLIPLAATFRHDIGPYLERYVLVSTTVMAFSILAVVDIGRYVQPDFPYEALFLVTLYIYFVSGLLFYEAIGCGVALWTAFLISNLKLQSPDLLLYEAYYLLLANVISWLGLYMLEYQARYSFLLERELRAHAVLDALTGTLNRRAFRSHLSRAWRQAQRDGVAVGIVLLDLDHFKRLNDEHGHPFGDSVLRRVARALKANAQRPLDAVGRYGGDEFIAVWFGPEPQWFSDLAVDLPEHLSTVAFQNEDEVYEKITISGGAVLAWPEPGRTMRDAIELADEKLYEVKRSGRNGIALAHLGKPPAPKVAQVADLRA